MLNLVLRLGSTVLCRLDQTKANCKRNLKGRGLFQPMEMGIFRFFSSFEHAKVGDTECEEVENAD